MPVSHLLLALAVVAIWGTNFVVMTWGLAEWPPLLLAGLRFTASALPWVLWIKRPATSWRILATFGVLLGVGQFGLLFLALKGHISAGLASLVVQTQVFFTIALSALFWRERLRGGQWLAFGLAGLGMGLIATHVLEGPRGGVSALGLAMVLGAAASWSAANLVARRAGRVDALAFMVWSSLFAAPPLLGLSLLVEGRDAIGQALQHASASAWAVVAWQAVGNTLFGYGAWNWLLARHPAATVTPSALFVPVFGMGASAWALGEPLPAWKLAAAVLVLGGLVLNIWVVRRSMARL